MPGEYYAVERVLERRAAASGSGWEYLVSSECRCHAIPCIIREQVSQQSTRRQEYSQQYYSQENS